MIEVEKNIPLPHDKYPFKKMGVGDSFFVPLREAPNFKGVSYKLAKKANIVIKVKLENDGHRCWRIK